MQLNCHNFVELFYKTVVYFIIYRTQQEADKLDNVGANWL